VARPGGVSFSPFLDYDDHECVAVAGLGARVGDRRLGRTAGTRPDSGQLHGGRSCRRKRAHALVRASGCGTAKVQGGGAGRPAGRGTIERVTAVRDALFLTPNGFDPSSPASSETPRAASVPPNFYLCEISALVVEMRQRLLKGLGESAET